MSQVLAAAAARKAAAVPTHAQEEAARIAGVVAKAKAADAAKEAARSEAKAKAAPAPKTTAPALAAPWAPVGATIVVDARGAVHPVFHKGAYHKSTTEKPDIMKQPCYTKGKVYCGFASNGTAEHVLTQLRSKSARGLVNSGRKAHGLAPIDKQDEAGWQAWFPVGSKDAYEAVLKAEAEFLKG